MIDLTFDTTTGIAELVEPVKFKAAGGVPVRVTLSSAPSGFAGSDIQLSIGTEEIEPQTLAFTNDFTGSATVYTAVLDASDSRLQDFMVTRGPEPVSVDLLIELIVTLDVGDIYAPSLPCVVEPPIVGAAPTPGVGPHFIRVDGDDVLISPTAAELVAANPELGSGGSAALSVGNSLFVDVDGSDVTGTRERFDKPFATHVAAKAAALDGDTIHFRPGTHEAANLGKAGIALNYHLDAGAIVQNTTATCGSVDDGPSGANADLDVTIGGDGHIINSVIGHPTVNIVRSGSFADITAHIVEQDHAVAQGDNNAAVWQEGGTLRMNVPYIKARSGPCFYWRGGDGRITFQDAISSEANGANLYELLDGAKHWHLTGQLLQGAGIGLQCYGGATGGDSFDVARSWVTIQKIKGGAGAISVTGSYIYFNVQKAECDDAGTSGALFIDGGTSIGNIDKLQGGQSPDSILGMCTLQRGRSFLSILEWEDTGQSGNACITCTGGFHDLDIGSMRRRTNGPSIYMAGGTLRLRSGIIDNTGQPRSIISNSAANPTVIALSDLLSINDGENVFISGSNSTPTINGTRVASRILLEPNQVTVPVNVTVAGSTGTLTFFDPASGSSCVQMDGGGTLILEAPVTLLTASGVDSIFGTGAGETVICKAPWFNADVDATITPVGSYNLGSNTQ